MFWLMLRTDEEARTENCQLERTGSGEEPTPDLGAWGSECECQTRVTMRAGEGSRGPGGGAWGQADRHRVSCPAEGILQPGRASCPRL